MLDVTAEGNSVLLPVKVVPGASRTRFMGEWDGRAKLAVAAPPEQGKANRALIVFLARLLDVPKRHIAVVSGHASPIKTIRIDHATTVMIHAKLRLDRS